MWNAIPATTTRPSRALTAIVAAAGVAGGAVLSAPAAAAQAPPWMDPSLAPEQRAQLVLDDLSLEEKATMLLQSGGPGLPDRFIPAIRGKDGCCGLAETDIDTTALPVGASLASTWDTELAQDYGAVSGDEAWRAGYTGIAGPTMDLVRSPYNGRQWEAFGEDPVLSGQIAAAQVLGQESHPVHSIVKHYNLNNQETRRGHVDAVVDERTLRELYTRPWEPVVAADPGAIMCAFNKVNGEYSCGNEHLLTDILKEDLGFRGYVSSDFDATHSFDDYTAGLDVSGPGTQFAGDNLVLAVQNGQVSEDRVDDAVLRVLYAMFSQGTVDDPPPGWDVTPQPTAEPLPARVLARHDAVAEEVAEAGTVLLQNERRTLPLDADRVDSIAVIGADADHYIDGGGSGAIQRPADLTTILEGITEATDRGTDVTHVPGTDPVGLGDTLTGLPPVPSDVLAPSGGSVGDGLDAHYAAPSAGQTHDTIDPQVNVRTGISGTLINTSQVASLPAVFASVPITAEWTGELVAPKTGTYEFGLSQIGQASLTIDDTPLVDADAGDNDVYGTDTGSIDLVAGESYDVEVEYSTDAPNQFDGGLNDQAGAMIRLGWDPPRGTVTSGVQEAVDAAEDADVAIVVARDYTGEASDRGDLSLPQDQDGLIEAVADANRRTVVVLATSGAVLTPWADDVEGIVETWYGGQAQGDALASVLFGETNPSGRLPVTFPVNERQVRGIGISNQFDTLTETDPEVVYDEGLFVGYRAYDEVRMRPQFPFGHGLSYTTFKHGKPELRSKGGRNVVTVDVRNNGKVTGTEVVQVYVGDLPGVKSPEKQLAGWAKVTLRPKRSAEVRIVLDEHAFEYWDTRAGSWQRAEGRVDLLVGGSSETLRKAKVAIPGS